MTRRGKKSCSGSGGGFREYLDDARVGARAYDAVDLGDERLQLLAIALRETSRDDQLLVGLLELRLLHDGVGGLGFGRIDERARIHDDGVGLRGIRAELPAGLAELRDHDFGVDEVFRAA